MKVMSHQKHLRKHGIMRTITKGANGEMQLTRKLRIWRKIKYGEL